MCLAIPSKIIEINDNQTATVDVEGARRVISLMLIDDPQIGDYVIVHAGFAIHKIDETAAMESLQLLRQAASMASELEDGPPE